MPLRPIVGLSSLPTVSTWVSKPNDCVLPRISRVPGLKLLLIISPMINVFIWLLILSIY